MTDPIRPAGGPPVPVPGPGGKPVASPPPSLPDGPVGPGGIQAQRATAPTVQSGQSEPASAHVVQTAMQQVRDFLKTLPPELQFSEDKESGHTVFKVVNPVTREVIRQFPPEEILAMARKLKSLEERATGVLYDKRH